MKRILSAFLILTFVQSPLVFAQKFYFWDLAVVETIALSMDIGETHILWDNPLKSAEDDPPATRSWIRDRYDMANFLGEFESKALQKISPKPLTSGTVYLVTPENEGRNGRTDHFLVATDAEQNKYLFFLDFEGSEVMATTLIGSTLPENVCSQLLSGAKISHRLQ